MPRGRKPKPIIDGKKECTKCKQMVPIEQYGKLTRAKNGLKSACKPCLAKWHKTPKARAWAREYYRDYYQDHKEAMGASSRKWLKNQPAGVYKIVCGPTGTAYIGQSTMLKKRFSRHKLDLRKGQHKNPHLQADYDKHGLDSLEFSVIVEYPCDTPSFILEDQEAAEMLRFIREGKPLYNSHTPEDVGDIMEDIYLEDEKMKELIAVCKQTNKTPKQLIMQYLDKFKDKVEIG